jgi:hypothetical protein
LTIGRDQYKVGTIPFNTVFNLATTQVQQQDTLAVAQGNIALNLISVYRALGGGWELRLEKENCAPASDAAAAPVAEPSQGPVAALLAPRPVPGPGAGELLWRREPEGPGGP